MRDTSYFRCDLLRAFPLSADGTPRVGALPFRYVRTAPTGGRLWDDGTLIRSVLDGPSGPSLWVVCYNGSLDVHTRDRVGGIRPSRSYPESSTFYWYVSSWVPRHWFRLVRLFVGAEVLVQTGTSLRGCPRHRFSVHCSTLRRAQGYKTVKL